MTRHKIQLGGPPTDVLVFLAGHADRWPTVEEIAAAVAPADAHSPIASVYSALGLLQTMGYVERTLRGWCPTSAGVAAVRAADIGTAILAALQQAADACLVRVREPDAYHPREWSCTWLDALDVVRGVLDSHEPRT